MAGNLRDDPHYIMLDNHDISCFDHGTYDLIQLLTMAQNMGKFTAVEVFFLAAMMINIRVVFCRLAVLRDCHQSISWEFTL